MDRDKLLQALRNAHAAGDTSAAQRIAAMIQALPTAAPEPTAAPVASDVQAREDYAAANMLPMPYDYEQPQGREQHPLIDAQAALNPQPRQAQSAAGDIGLSALSGAARGATELAALPATIGGGLDYLYERAGLIPEGARQNVPSVGGLIRGAASDFTSGATEYEPQSTAGEYARTVGEFVGGGSGPRAGTVAGLLSEGAGQLTEGTALEPYARIGGGVVGGILGQPRVTQAPVRNPNTPAGQRAIAANQLRGEGINVTAGQQANSPLLRRMEGTLDAPDIQPEQFTRSIMARLGSNSDAATPQALRAIQDDLVRQMDDAVSGVSVAPNARHATAADDVASTYLSNVETGSAVPRVREIAQSISSRATSGQPIDLSTLRTFRQDIGALTTSSNDATRRAAHSLRRLLDDMTDTALAGAGRTDDIAKLADARRTYRDFIAVRDASTRAGDAGVGILSPTQLNQSMIRVMGRENYGVGRTTPTSDFTRSAAAMMRSAPAVQSGGVRELASLPMLLSGAGGYAAGGPLGLLAGAAAPTVGQIGMRSAPIQNLLINPSTVLGRATRTSPGLLAQQ